MEEYFNLLLILAKTDEEFEGIINDMLKYHIKEKQLSNIIDINEYRTQKLNK